MSTADVLTTTIFCRNHSALLVLSRAFVQIRKDREAIVEALCFSEPVDNENMFLWAICSWKTGAPERNHSSQIMTTSAVLGKKHKEQHLDSIPTPAVENAVGRTQIFSEEYSSDERAAGIHRIKEKINELLSDTERAGILFCDKNHVVFHYTESPHKDIHALIQSYNVFSLVLNLRDEIYVYKHKRHNHAILLYTDHFILPAPVSKEFPWNNELIAV